jgi:outer membrane biosynthesis protein TonB
VEWGSRRGAERPGASSIFGSLLIHGVVVAIAVMATRRPPEPLTYITYEVEIVSPPPAAREDPVEDPAPTPPEEELVVERPEEAPEEVAEAIPEPEAQPEDPEPEPEPEPEPPTPDPEPEPDPPEEEATEPPATDPEAETAEESGEDLEIRMEGLRRDFPEYYGNIIRQIRRCFRPPPGLPGGLETTVYFVIRADGSVVDARFVEQSGNFDFDYEALGAVVDCAGQGRFGALPEELPYERLPIQFTFRPSGEDLSTAPTVPQQHPAP